MSKEKQEPTTPLAIEVFKTRQPADTWAAWPSDGRRTLWADPGEHSSLHPVEHSLTLCSHKTQGRLKDGEETRGCR